MARKAHGLAKSLHLPEHQALCELLVAARHKAGLTQQAVAQRLKRPQSFVSKYEGGERRLDLIEFVTVAAALDADPLRLLRVLLKQID